MTCIMQLFQETNIQFFTLIYVKKIFMSSVSIAIQIAYLCSWTVWNTSEKDAV